MNKNAPLSLILIILFFYFFIHSLYEKMDEN